MSDKQLLYEGRYLNMVTHQNWEYAERTNISGIVAMVAVTREGKLIFLEQYRRPVECPCIELPAGLAGDHAGAEGEDLEIAAQRELLEETGYTAGKLIYLFDGPPSPGACSEVVSWYLAVDLERAGPGGGDDSEDIEVHEVQLDEAHAFFGERQAAGCLIDPKVFLGIYFAKRYLDEQTLSFI
ncbi:MAG: NUDIX hydrolase [Acidobacteriota bacterium]|nr:NUDIX hydrolase [Acidobacteriota bacterium]